MCSSDLDIGDSSVVDNPPVCPGLESEKTDSSSVGLVVDCDDDGSLSSGGLLGVDVVGGTGTLGGAPCRLSETGVAGSRVGESAKFIQRVYASSKARASLRGPIL